MSLALTPLFLGLILGKHNNNNLFNINNISISKKYKSNNDENNSSKNYSKFIENMKEMI